MRSVCDCRYLERFTEELEQISIVNGMKGRDGQQHSGRLQAINMTREREAKQYKETGFGKQDTSFLEVQVQPQVH